MFHIYNEIKENEPNVGRVVFDYNGKVLNQYNSIPKPLPDDIHDIYLRLYNIYLSHIHGKPLTKQEAINFLQACTDFYKLATGKNHPSLKDIKFIIKSLQEQEDNSEISDKKE